MYSELSISIWLYLFRKGFLVRWIQLSQDWKEKFLLRTSSKL